MIARLPLLVLIHCVAVLAGATAQEEDALARFGDPQGARDYPRPFAGEFALGKEECIVLVGQENLVREQDAGALEERLTTAFADVAPRFRFMAWEGDTVYAQRRQLHFGDWEAQLKASGASVLIAQFGQMEVLDGKERVPEFVAAYSRLLDEFGRQTKRLVLVSPMPFERPLEPEAPDLTLHNDDVKTYVDAIRQMAGHRKALFVDLFTPFVDRGSEGTDTRRLTGRDGIHLTPEGVEFAAEAIAKALEVAPKPVQPEGDLRRAIVEKNRLWFDCWRPMNWAFAFGDRTTQAFGQPAGGHPWLKEELERMKALVEDEEARIHGWAMGSPPPPRADEPLMKRAVGDPESDPAEALAAMTVREGYAVNLFAGEAEGVINPIQMAWDEKGRLYIACSPTYPHIIPGRRPGDYILRCSDEDGDGVADRFERYAEGLHMVQGVEPGDGGVYVCAGTRILHFIDTDDDGHADGRTVVLSGFGTGDAHQLVNSISRGPDGCYWFTQGLHIDSYVETPWGVSRLEKSGVWRWNPRSLRLDGFFNGAKAGHNCWGVAFDDFFQAFHKTGDRPHGYYLTAGLMRLDDPAEYHPLGALFEAPAKTNALDFIGTRHLPDELQGCAVLGGFMGNTLDLYRLHDDGAGFRSEKLPDLIRSSDPSFRPVDVSVGPDGAIYVCDFHNTLIGHYQTSYRDPGRDYSHGRIWRLTAKGRPLARPPDLALMTVENLVEQLRSPERWTRYQVKRLLFDGDRNVVVRALDAIADAIADDDPQVERLRMELAGVYRAHAEPRVGLVRALVASKDPRVRAYGIRTAGAWASRSPEVAELLARGASDGHPRVRLEALVAAMERPAEEAFRHFETVFSQPRDRFIDYALTNAARVVRPYWQSLAADGSLEKNSELFAFLQQAAGAAQPEISAGEKIYQSLCLNCHQPDGKGLPGIYPPIAESETVNGDAEILIKMLLHGLQGSITREDRAYQGVMPPSGLTNGEIAEVLSYLRRSFGNDAAAVSESQVRSVREATTDQDGPWDAGKLSGAESELPGSRKP